MFTFKAKIATLFVLVVFIAGSAVFITHKVDAKNKPEVVVKYSSNPNEDVKIGKMILKAVHKNPKLISEDLSIAYPVDIGKPDSDASFRTKWDYVWGGKSITGTAYANGHLEVLMKDVTLKDIKYDKSTQTVTIWLPKPTSNNVHIELDKKKTDEQMYSGPFSGGFKANDILQDNLKFEDTGKLQFFKTSNLMDTSKGSLKDGLSHLLNTVTTIDGTDLSFDIEFKK